MSNPTFSGGRGGCEWCNVVSGGDTSLPFHRRGEGGLCLTVLIAARNGVVLDTELLAE